jgi:DNA segregation ATPase FtsK/SpoIIIE-like protein
MPTVARNSAGRDLEGYRFKGTGYFVRAPGAEPVKYRGFILPARYEPPTTINRKVISAKPRARLFTAGRVAPDPDTVIEEEIAAESVIEGPPRSLVLTVGPQLAAAYNNGKRPPQLWSPPLDDPIPLDAVLEQADAVPARPDSAPWWPLGEIDRPRRLSHGLLTYGLDNGNVSILGMQKDEVSMAVQTFILSAAARYSRWSGCVIWWPGWASMWCCAIRRTGWPASSPTRRC